MFTVTLPYDIGAFVKVKDANGEGKIVEYCGTVDSYTITEYEYLVWVIPYKSSYAAEFSLYEVEPMTDEEIDILKGENNGT